LLVAPEGDRVGAKEAREDCCSYENAHPRIVSNDRGDATIDSRGIVWSMESALRLLIMVALAGSAILAQSSERRPPGFEDRLRSISWLYVPPVDGERCVQFSSYDRRSDAGPDNAGAWYANDDRGNYLRVEERDGVREHVLVDVAGPGSLVRLWSANPTGKLFFDLDGERVWTVSFAQLCQGATPAAPHPLAGMCSRGGNVYLPIAFQERLIISSDQADLYYLADVALLPAGSAAPPFVVAPELGEAMASALRDGRHAATANESSRPPDVRCTAGEDRRAKLAVGTVLESFFVEVDRDGADANSLGEVLRNVILRVSCGPESTVEVPLCDFFAGGTGWVPWSSYLMGIEPGGRAYCHWPMPMPDGGEVWLEVVGPLRGLAVSLTGYVRPLAPAIQNPLLFRANYHQVKQVPTRPYSDHLVLDAAGRGRFVGCSLLVRNPSRIWWGEGDEKFYVDGEPFPSWFGTGTEDYFGYAWCDPTPFSAPFHAQVQCDGPMNYGFTQLHRAHLFDNVPFQRSFRYDLERWHWVPNLKMDYATVAYWYGAKGASGGLPELPAAGERRPEPVPPIRQFVAEGALEGEALEVLACTGGTHEVQNLAIFERVFSKDAHRWWRDGEVADELVLAVPVAHAGRYRVTLAMVRADDFAQVQVSLAGTKLGEPFDGYAPQVSSSGPFVAGEVQLEAAVHELRFRIVGKNAKAKGRMMVGLDYLVLEKL